MLPKRLSVKFFAQNPEVISQEAFIPVFQKWIQRRTVPGLLIDVADYSHVPDGPGILIIAHEGDYAYDIRDGRPGLSYISKRPVADTLNGLLEHVLTAVLAAIQRINEKEKSLKGLSFDLTSAEITFVDRLNTPNTTETFEALKAQIDLPLTLTRVENDPRGCLTIKAESADFAQLLEQLKAVTSA